MILVLACMGLGVLCATAGPWLLRDMGWQVARPARALRLWFALFVLGVAAFLGSVLAAIIQAAGATDSSGAVTATATVLSGWLLLAVLGVAIGVITHHAGPLVEGRRTGGASVLLLVARSETQRMTVDSAEVSVVAAPTAFAVATRDCDADVVISQSLVDVLTPAELRSVIHHELGHLQGRHSMLRTVAMVAGSAAPRARCGRGFAQTVHLLTELAADDTAARACGPEIAASALCALATLTEDPGAALRAQRLSRRSPQSSARRPESLRTRPTVQ
ncbi:M48 family metalloprotease [Flexivirga caeni]|uniref:Peptidase M48 domain-containing protein n=1 Tax=Flexivirga caeni TaxID=2294115 RepID=A0A3M9M688_9MICO|nr:M48 family metalloprotease [Flexivirga caeni]RNI20685.1 hypothetical protein EFY87_13955 [Flexivirga caeni]